MPSIQKTFRPYPTELALTTADWNMWKLDNLRIGLDSMNMVAKMNRMASTGNIVLGGDLHQILSRFSFEEYLLELGGELNIGIR